MHTGKPPLPHGGGGSGGLAAGGTVPLKPSRLRKDASELSLAVDDPDNTIASSAAAFLNHLTGRVTTPTRATLQASSSHGSNVGNNINQQSGNGLVDPSRLFQVDAEINQDILLLIRGYLRRCGLYSTATTLQNESQIQTRQARSAHRQVREAVLEGDWEALREMSKSAPSTSVRRAFLYLVNRQEFLELVNKQESQQAFAHLLRRLKPLESQARTSGDDFRDLAYLATCKSVTDSPVFREWEGVATSRKRLARELCGMVKRSDLFLRDDVAAGEEEDDAGALDNWMAADEQDGMGGVSTRPGALDDLSDSDDDLESLGDPASSSHIQAQKPTRLVSLLQQAYAYQVEKKSMVADLDVVPKISSLLVDFQLPVLPADRCSRVLVGHEQGVKAMCFVGERRMVASGSSDTDVSLWDLEQQDVTRTVLKGHTGRVWDVASSRDGSHIVSVSADGTLRQWDVDQAKGSVVTTQHSGDIYSVGYHPESRSHVVTCGHDQTVQLIDLEKDVVVRTFKGHQGSVVHAVFNPVGNLIVSGSKDATVKFFDVVSGVCVKTIPQLLGAVTSVQLNRQGDKLLTSTKDSSNRLWDLRTASVITRFKGHVNSSKSFIRCQFGSTDKIIVGGSEEGSVYVWDSDSGKILEKLLGHSGSVFRAIWSNTYNVLGSCSDDGTVRLWDAKRSSSASFSSLGTN